MKVAVTGASGFIGRYVLRQLSYRQVNVVAVTRNTSRLIGCGDGVEVVEMDIAHCSSGCFSLLGCPDILIHLAWDGLPNYKSLHHFESELPNQYSFLKTMVEEGLPSLFVTGTCFEYGMQSGVLSENIQMKPENPYGYAKDALRRQLEFLQTSHAFVLKWARLFYMYGEGQSKSSLYAMLKKAVVRGDETFNMSGGEQLRDYLPVEEIARLIVLLSVYNNETGAVNICSGKPVSIRRLVEKWIAEKGWNIKLNLDYYPYPDYEPMAFWGDRSCLDMLLNNLSCGGL